MSGVAFELPSLGADMDEGTLVQWRVQPGDAVHRGQVVAVVDTSKAAVDVEIWQDGVVEALVIKPGTKVPVGTVIMTLQPAGSPVAGAAEAVPSRLPDAHALVEATRHPVSPAARRRARELEVDLGGVAGTGPHGSVIVADVEQAAAHRTPARAMPLGEGSTPTTAAPVPAPAAAPIVEPGAAPGPTPVDRQLAMRAAIAAAMARSKREIPHYYLAEPIPMRVALDWLADRNAAVPLAERMLPAALLLKAVARAVSRVPELNGTTQAGRFVPSMAVHAGIAIALRGGGLVAPAIHDAHDKSLTRLMGDLSDLVRRARAGSLRSSEMSDPTITVTLLGDQGVESVWPVIYPPQVAIVGFGRIAERAWAQDGAIRAMPVVTATLAADHRVSDGHRGALFLAELREWLQRPAAIDARS